MLATWLVASAVVLVVPRERLYRRDGRDLQRSTLSPR
jgi:hypothetical protein